MNTAVRLKTVTVSRLRLLSALRRFAEKTSPFRFVIRYFQRPRISATALFPVKKAIPRSAEIWRKAKRPQSIFRTRATICLTPTTVHMTPGTGVIRRRICRRTATLTMLLISANLLIFPLSAQDEWSPTLPQKPLKTVRSTQWALPVSSLPTPNG